MQARRGVRTVGGTGHGGSARWPRGRAVLLGAACLLAWSVAQAEDPSEGLGAARLLGGDASLLAAYGDQTGPAAACDTSGAGVCLTVWEDLRAGEPDIFAARVDGAGNPLDSVPIALATGLGEQRQAAVAYGAGVFLVAWESRAWGAWSVRGAVVSRDGALLHPDFEIAAASGPRRAPDVAFDGTGFLVVWSDSRSGKGEIYGTRVTPSGALENPGGRRLMEEDRAASDPAVGFNGSRYLLAWSQLMPATVVGDTAGHGDVRGLFLDASGVPQADTSFVISAARLVFLTDTTDADEVVPALATDGRNFLVAWRVAEQSIYGHLIDTTGAAVEVTAPIELVTTTGARGRPQVAFDGNNFLVAWPLLVGAGGSFGVSGGRVAAADGARLDPTPLPLRTDRAEGVDLCWIGDRYLLASSIRSAAGDYDILGLSVLETGQAQPWASPILSLGPPTQIPCGASTDGTDYLVVWEEQRADGWRVQGARVDADGNLQDPGVFPLLAGPASQRRNPSVAYGAGGHLLVWTERQGNAADVRARLLSAAGEPLTGELQVGAAAAGARPAVACDGSRFLLAWRNVIQTPNGSRWLVVSQGVARDGGQLAIADTLSKVHFEGVQTSSDPSVVFDGANYFLAWSQASLGVFGGWQSAAGGDSRPSFALAGGQTMSAPALACDGALIYVLWEDAGGIYGTRLTRGGAVLDPGRARFASQSFAGEPPAIGFDGSAPLAIWRAPEAPRWQLQGSRLAASGELLDRPALTIGAQAALQRWPSFAPGASGRALVTFASLAVADGLPSLRVTARTWYQDAPDLALSVHQNPGVPSDVGIYLFSTEPLVEGTVALHANGDPLTLEVTDAAQGVRRGWYHAMSAVTVTLRGEGRDAAGNRGTTTRVFAIGPIPARAGGDLAGPGNEVLLHCPAGSLAEDAYLMILPDADGGGFVLSPPGQALNGPVSLSLAPPAFPSPSGRWVLERETPEGWVPVQALSAGAAGRLSVSVESLGHFRVLPAPDDLSVSSRLSLRLGPGPFRDRLDVRYALPREGAVELAVYDLNGRCLRVLVRGRESAGPHVATWDGKDQAGRQAGSGAFFTRLTFEGQTRTGRCIRVR